MKFDYLSRMLKVQPRLSADFVRQLRLLVDESNGVEGRRLKMGHVLTMLDKQPGLTRATTAQVPGQEAAPEAAEQETGGDHQARDGAGSRRLEGPSDPEDARRELPGRRPVADPEDRPNRVSPGQNLREGEDAVVIGGIRVPRRRPELDIAQPQGPSGFDTASPGQSPT